MSVILNGSSQYLQIAEALLSGDASGSAYTIVGWYKTDSLTADQTIYSQASSSADTEYFALAAAGAQAGDYVTHTVRDTESGQNQYINSSIAYSTGTWQHGAAVRTSSTSKQAYLNGGNSGTGGAVETLVTGDRSAVGCLYRQSITWYFSGKLAEVAIWDIALTTSEIAELAAGATPTTIQSGNLQGYWPLLSDATDSSGNGKDLTAVGSPTYSSSDHPVAGAGASFADKVYSKQLVAIGNNEVWREATAGTMSELTAANGTINTDNPLTVAEAFQKMFVANQANLKVADFANTKIATADLNTHAPDKGNILTGGTSGAKMVVDYITSVTADAACTIYGYRTTTATFASGETVTGTDDDGNSITFATSAAETAPPHWYDWTPYGNDTTNFGSMPSSAYLICRYRGRLVLSGHPNYPHMWYMSRVSNPWNWKYSSTEPLSAVAGNNVDAGEIGDIVRALIPYGDDFLIFGCANSMHLMDGDPAFGGSIDELSDITGIYGPWAWCKDENDNLYFWGSNGLYKMTGGRSKPINISQGHYPKWADDWAVASATHRVVLTYDPSRHGIIISKTTLADGTNLNYWYDLKTEGFYPETYPTACGIFSSWYYDSDASGTRELILGSNDGYLRTFLDTAKDDDAGASDTAISSYLTLPIIKLSEIEDSEGKLTSLTIELAGGAASGDFSDTDGVSYELHVGDDAETVLEDIRDGATARESGTLSGTGRQSRIRKRVRGRWLGIKFYNSTASETFAINSVTGEVKPAGKIKS
jgi:hypothetical protein